MCKLLAGVIAKDLCEYLKQEKLQPDEQKGCRRGSYGKNDQVIIDKTVLKDCKKRLTILSLVWIDFKKVYDFFPHNFINKCIELFRTANNVIKFLEKIMQQWKLLLTSTGKDL